MDRPADQRNDETRPCRNARSPHSDADQVRDKNSNTTIRTGLRTRGRARNSIFKPIIRHTASNLGQGGHSRVPGHPGDWISMVRQYGHPFPIPIPTNTPPQPGLFTIASVTSITCRRSQITGESTCPMGYVHSNGNRLIQCMSLTTSVTWLRFCEPDPQIISLDKSDPKVSANPQDAARDARFSSRAG